MKTALLHKAEKVYFILVVVLFFLLVSNSFGQNQKIADLSKHKYALQNLIMGIQSENDGVRESSIYLAGQYRFIDTEDALIKQLKVERRSDIKVLIGLALLRMNSEKGMNELQQAALRDKDQHVKSMSQAIYNEYLVINSHKTAAAE